MYFRACKDAESILPMYFRNRRKGTGKEEEKKKRSDFEKKEKCTRIKISRLGKM